MARDLWPFAVYELGAHLFHGLMHATYGLKSMVMDAMVLGWLL